MDVSRRDFLRFSAAAGGTVRPDRHPAAEERCAIDERQARIVELRFFGGLTVEETAEALDTSPATIKREWASARAWLYQQISGS